MDDNLCYALCKGAIELLLLVAVVVVACIFSSNNGGDHGQQ